MQTDYGAFVQKITVKPPPSNFSAPRPLTGLTFAIKDIFDLEGHATGFGNPDWAKTHPAASTTAPSVLSCLNAGATCIGKTVMDELAYSINGENKHYGTPRNPCSPARVPGGSSSGSAVAVAANLADFSLGTDTGGSVRAPASHCGILGFRPSHGVVSTDGVVPMAQSFDTVGWFARDSTILKQVGDVLLRFPSSSSPTKPTQIILADDCFGLSCTQNLQTETLIKSVTQIFGGDILKNIMLGDYLEKHVPSLKFFGGSKIQDRSLYFLSSALRTHQRYEFKKNHEEWVLRVKPDLGTGISERVREAMESTDEHVGEFENVQSELYEALSSLLGDFGVLAMPTLPGDPPKLNMDTNALKDYREKAFGLLSVAGVSGFCQVSIPLGMYGDVAVDISLLAKHGSDRFLLSVVESLQLNLREQFAEICCAK